MNKEWAVFTALASILLGMSVSSQAIAQIPSPIPSHQPDFALRVWVEWFSDGDKPQVDQEVQALHERVKKFLNEAKLGVPLDRINYFEPRWVNNPPITGWSGMIKQVKPIKNGYAVTLSVSAVNGDGLHLLEHYSIIGGKVQYRGCTVPPPHYRIQGGR